MGKQGEAANIKMVIEIKNKKTKFEKISIGSLFAYPAHSYCDEDIYMATEEYGVKGKDGINATCLFDGSLHEFKEDDDVRLIDNAKIVIE